MASATVDNGQMDSGDDIKITNWIWVPVSRPATLIIGSRTHSGMYRHGSGHDITQILSESRSIRVVLYGSTPVESEHRFWIDPDVTYAGVAKALAEMYPSQELVVLQANWGPRPYWTESHPDSPICSTCRVLYAILKDQAKPYTMGVVRTSLSDYPIPIYVPTSKSSATLLEAVITSYPKLTGQVKSIVLHFGDHDSQSDPWDNDFARGQPYPAAPLLITTLDEPSEEFLAGSLYEAFSPLSPKASTSSDSDGMIPPILQISFAECKLLVQRAYDLDAFPLQMIHLSEAIFHTVISLARSLNPVFENTSSSIGDALSAEDDLADYLRVAPLLCRQIEELLDVANGIMDHLETGRFKREGAQQEIENIFVTLCGDLPGAVTVRCSEKDFKKFGIIDCEGLDTLALDKLDVKSVRAAIGESFMEDRRVADVDLMIDPDYHSDVGNPPGRSSEMDRPFLPDESILSLDRSFLTLGVEGSHTASPAVVPQSPPPWIYDQHIGISSTISRLQGHVGTRPVEAVIHADGIPGPSGQILGLKHLEEQRITEAARARRLDEQYTALEAEARHLEEQRADLEAETGRLEGQNVNEEAGAGRVRRLNEHSMALEAERANRLEEQRAASEAGARLLEEQRATLEAGARLLEEQRVALEAGAKRLEEQRGAEEAARARRLMEQRVAEVTRARRLNKQRAAEEATARRREEQRIADAARTRRLQEQRAAEEAEVKALEEQRISEAGGARHPHPEEQRMSEMAEAERLQQEQIADQDRALRLQLLNTP